MSAKRRVKRCVSVDFVQLYLFIWMLVVVKIVFVDMLVIVLCVVNLLTAMLKSHKTWS